METIPEIPTTLFYKTRTLTPMQFRLRQRSPRAPKFHADANSNRLRRHQKEKRRSIITSDHSNWSEHSNTAYHPETKKRLVWNPGAEEERNPRAYRSCPCSGFNRRLLWVEMAPSRFTVRRPHLRCLLMWDDVIEVKCSAEHFCSS